MSTMNMRRPVRSRTQLLSQTKPLRRRRKPMDKPAWDDTTKDLSVFKLSNKELQRKHELHKPKHDHERLLRKIHESKLMMMADGISFNTTSMTDQNETGMLDNEASMLDDYERVYKGLPQVTKAPYTNDPSSFIHELGECELSRYDVLSKSVVKHPELNYCSDESVYEDEDETTDGHGQGMEMTGFQPNMDLKKYKDILDESYSMIKQDHKDEEKRRRILKQSDKQNRQLPTTSTNDGMFDGQKKPVRKQRDKENNTTSYSVQTNKSMNTFDDMKKVLNELEEEIDDYEKECGRSEVSTNSKDYGSCGGYTVSLLSTATRLIKHLKESEKQLRNEMAMRKEILMAFEEQKSMIDALTTDLFDTQEENKLMKNEMEEMKTQIQAQNIYLKTEIQDLQRKFNGT